MFDSPAGESFLPDAAAVPEWLLEQEAAWAQEDVDALVRQAALVIDDVCPDPGRPDPGDAEGIAPADVAERVVPPGGFAGPDPIDPRRPGGIATATSGMSGAACPPDDAVISVAETIPSGWTGLELDLATAEPTRLSDAALVDAIVGWERLAGWAQARQARLLAEFATRRPPDPPQAAGAEKTCVASRYAPDEIGVALRLSRGTALARLAQSVQLARTLPATAAAWQEGRLDAFKVRAICDATQYLDPETATAVQDRILHRAPAQTLSQLRSALARAVVAVDPDGAAARHREARKDRRVALGQEKEGMASLWALLPAPGAQAAYQWLTRLARSLGHDPRGMDARRADLLVELLTGELTITTDDATSGGDTPGSGAAHDGGVVPGDADRDENGSTGTAATPATGTGSPPAGEPPTRSWSPASTGKPLVQIVMPYSTLIGADHQPCELVGYGSIPADLAREIAADAVWKRLVTDPLSGALLDHGRTTYRPPAALSDFVRARDVECRFPTCRRRAIDVELDHAVDWAKNGHTSHTNLYGACLLHHRMKHHGGWSVTQHPDGTITWTAPTGHAYPGEPHDYRPEPQFVHPADAAEAADPAGDTSAPADPGSRSGIAPARSGTSGPAVLDPRAKDVDDVPPPF